MSKNTIIAIVVLVVVVVGGYFIFRSKGADDYANNGAGTEQPAPTESKKMAFSDFLQNTKGESYKCTVDQIVENSTTKGTIYISGGMMRGEFNIKTEGANMESTMILRDGYSYTWVSALPGSGFKSKVAANPAGQGTAGSSGIYGYDGQEIGDYDCQPWVAESAKFTLPTNITFKELLK